jgi:hypothetical protein
MGNPLSLNHAFQGGVAGFVLIHPPIVPPPGGLWGFRQGPAGRTAPPTHGAEDVANRLLYPPALP